MVLPPISPLPQPPPLVESDDLIPVRFPCHPDLPLKIAEGHGRTVGCLVCGERYPLDLIRDAG